MTYFDVGQLGRGAAAIGRMVQDYDERIANLEAERDAALVRAERAEAERDALRAQIDAEGWRPVDGLQEADRK